MSHPKSGAPAAAPRLFSPQLRARLLAQRVGAPTGVTVELGGLTFDLRPLSSSEALEIFDLIDEVAKLTSGLKNLDAVDGAEMATFLAARGKEVVALVRSVLRRSGDVQGDEEQEIFETWFSGLDLLPTVRALLPKVIEANGLGAVINRPPKPAAEGAAPAQSPGTPSTQSATS